MAATAELTKTNLIYFNPELYLIPEIPRAERIDLLPQDELSRARAIRFIGQVALNEFYIEPTEAEAPNTSLLKSIERASNGNEEARMSVETNVRIAVAEALIKAGHISTVNMEINEKGYWMQFGQSMMHVHANALKTKNTYLHSGLVERAKAETINGQRIEDMGRQGELDDNYVFVASLVPSENEVPLDISVKKAGFFGETMTAALQLTGLENGKGKVESAFVAGVTGKNSSRHDIKVLRKIYKLAGYEVDNWEPLDFLSNPLKIHKSNLPNGIADIVELYDQLASESLDDKLFFGQKVLAQDYSNFAEASRIRENGLKTVTSTIIDELISKKHKLKNPEDAINELADLIRTKTVAYAIKDKTINPNVFGSVSEGYLIEARIHYEQGQMQMMEQKLNSAIEKAVISVCGGTTGKLAELFGMEFENDDKKVEEDEFGPLVFECAKGHKNTRPRGKLIDNCTTCHESVRC